MGKSTFIRVRLGAEVRVIGVMGKDQEELDKNVQEELNALQTAMIQKAPFYELPRANNIRVLIAPANITSIEVGVTG
jgi:hypothetical protein